MISTVATVCSNLSKIYGDKFAIKDLNLQIPERSIYGFLGENGAGKSTTLQILSGLVYPSKGVYGSPISTPDAYWGKFVNMRNPSAVPIFLDSRSTAVAF